MSAHLTYLEAVVTGLIQGVTELFPVSSLGHNVLIPALVGGSWANALNVSAPNSPYLAFIVGLHVATAIAMIAYFWRDWLRIVRGFFSSLRTRSITTPDERLAWMIILATIPVGLVGVALQKEFTKVFAKPELAAVFLAVNGVILLVSERMRRVRDNGGGGVPTVALAVAAPARADQCPAGPFPAGPGGLRGGPAGRAGLAAPARRGQRGGRSSRGSSSGRGPTRGTGRTATRGTRGTGRRGRTGTGARSPASPLTSRSSTVRSSTGSRGTARRSPDARSRASPRTGRSSTGSRSTGRSSAVGTLGAGSPVRGGTRRAARRAGTTSATRGWRATGSGPPGGTGTRRGTARAAVATRPGMSGGRPPGRPGADGAAADPAVAADRRLSTMGYKRAVIVGAAQILALLPGISRDGIVTVTGMGRGLSRQDAVRFSFLLSAPVILAAGVLKAKDLAGPMSKGMHGPILVGSLISGIGAYLSIRFLTKYFSENKSLNPFGIYCLIAGVGSLAYLVLK